MRDKLSSASQNQAPLFRRSLYQKVISVACVLKEQGLRGIVTSTGMVDKEAQGFPLAVDGDGGVCYTVNRVGRSSIDPREGGEMKRHWLRGLLLGVSMALLLSGGVARRLSESASNRTASCAATSAGSLGGVTAGPCHLRVGWLMSGWI
jgi:hypothetical protein